MISRLANMAFSMLLYFSFATLIAEGIMAGYVLWKWHPDRETLAQMVAVARGIQPPAVPNATQPPPDEAGPEQPSLDAIIAARAVKDKNLQLREQALANALAQLEADQDKLAKSETQYKLDREDFETKVAAAAKTATASGLEEVRRILQTVKPKQAKEILQGMIEQKEQNEVVMLLSGMTDSKRAKIIAEFKDTDDNKRIEEVLRLIRKGAPEGPLAQHAMDRLRPANTAIP